MRQLHTKTSWSTDCIVWLWVLCVVAHKGQLFWLFSNNNNNNNNWQQTRFCVKLRCYIRAKTLSVYNFHFYCCFYLFLCFLRCDNSSYTDYGKFNPKKFFLAIIFMWVLRATTRIGFDILSYVQQKCV